MRVHKNKNVSEESPEISDIQGKRIMKIVTRTETGFLNTATGNMNLIQPSNISMNEPDYNNEIPDYENCEICKAMSERGRNKKIYDNIRSNQRDVIDPDCELCIRENKLESNYPTSKFENENYKRSNEKISSRKDHDLYEREEYFDRIKTKVTTTCRPEECIKKIRELLDNIETSTFSRSYKEKSEEHFFSNRNRDEDYHFKNHRKPKYNTEDDDYGTAFKKISSLRIITKTAITSTPIYRIRENHRETKYSNTRSCDHKDQGLRSKCTDSKKSSTKFNFKENQMEKYGSTDKYYDEEETLNTKRIFKKKRKKEKNNKKHERHNRSGKKHIRKENQDEGDADHENRGMNYANVTDESDDSVQQKANNLRFILFEKIKAQNEDEHEDGEYDVDDDRDYDESDNNEELEEEFDSQSDEELANNNKKNIKISNILGKIESGNENVEHYIQYTEDVLRSLITSKYVPT